ncbi:MAG: hypothetical protein V3V47_01855 [Desulfobacteria bacterium]
MNLIAVMLPGDQEYTWFEIGDEKALKSKFCFVEDEFGNRQELHFRPSGKVLLREDLECAEIWE